MQCKVRLMHCKVLLYCIWKGFEAIVMFRAILIPRGVLPNKEVGGGGGLDLTSSLEAKFGARSGQVHQLRGKIWKVLSPQDAKVGKKSQFWGHIWNSEGKIWGICHLYFWRQNLGLQQEFQRQNLGPSPPPDLLIWKYPLGSDSLVFLSIDLLSTRAGPA